MGNGIFKDVEERGPAGAGIQTGRGRTQLGPRSKHRVGRQGYAGARGDKRLSTSLISVPTALKITSHMEQTSLIQCS